MKKNCMQRILRRSMLKTLLFMKITAILLFITMFQVQAATYAQQKRFTFNLKDTSVEEVLKVIESQSEYGFLYNDNQIDLTRVVSVKAKNLTVNDVLKKVFEGTNNHFVITDRHVVITKSDMAKSVNGFAAQQDRTITGKVTDGNGEPLPGVSVVVKGTTIGITTDFDGVYKLDIPGNAKVLVFSFVGMQDEEVTVDGQQVINVAMKEDAIGIEEVVAIGYATVKKESITGSIDNVTSDDLKRVHAGTVASTLAGKIAGVSFRHADARPGSSANIQIRNMGTPLFVIDGVQKDQGQFNNIAPQDIESITVLKDASAAIYGVKAANGVVVVTTKRGSKNTKASINVDAYHGWQNWTRFPKTVGADKWMLGKVEADMNKYGKTDITPEELAKWQAGTEKGYQSFNWYDFIVKENAPQTSANINVTGGSNDVRYYLSATWFDQKSVLGREFVFNRTNIQSNVEADVTDRLTVGVQINGRIESRDQPGVPGVDDYWQPIFALFRNTPMERPYANDNPEYINNIGHNETNWGYLNKETSGYWTEDWRVLQANFNGTYDFPIKGLKATGRYSYYLADRLMNGHEYTYDVYTYFEEEDEYRITGGSSNPWRERGTHKVYENVYQGSLNYDREFDKHHITALAMAERIERKEQDIWVHSVPKTNVLPLLYFDDMDTYRDQEWESARIGYIGRFTYNYDNKYYFEFSGRRDGSWKFHPDKRWGFFPSFSAGWRITRESFMKNLLGESTLDIKLRGSYGELGDDNIGIGAFDYLTGYNYNTSTVVMDGDVIVGSRDRGMPVKNISWFTSKIKNIGADFSLAGGKYSGSIEYFHRKREGLLGNKYDILLPDELGYGLPKENVSSDAHMGGEITFNYNGEFRDVKFQVGTNLSFARSKFLSSYKPMFGNSWDHYRNSSEDRWNGRYWGLTAIGQFQTQEEIDNYQINNDGQGNRTMLPGDIKYEDKNGDGVISDLDKRYVGFGTGSNPLINGGLHFSAEWRGFDLKADFSFGSMYTRVQSWEGRWPFQNNGGLGKIFEDRWRHEDPYDVNSPWIAGKYPALRFNDRWHSNNWESTFWMKDVKYLRCRTVELGYTIPRSVLDLIHIKKARVYVNGYNLFSIDNVKEFGVDPEITNSAGLQYPQSRLINVGVNLTF
ncbi:SusC/RagA family TonB-linked outer membrane protein [Puteibacter caeruleilacunae]|nr:SusC/RagA family TonB-linked outer membrane protein [Puteibacter caeruleilacunae]